MKKFILLALSLWVCLLLLIPQIGNAQGWERIYGNNKVFDVEAAPAANGEVFLLGEYLDLSPTGNVPFVHRIDTDGDIIWTYLDSLSASPDRYVMKIAGLSDGGAMITTGLSNTNGPLEPIMVQKISPTGQLVWTLEIPPSKIGFVENMMETSNGNMALFGSTWQDPIDIKIIGAIVVLVNNWESSI